MFQAILLKNRGTIVLAIVLSICGSVSGLLMLRTITAQLNQLGTDQAVAWSSLGIFLLIITAVLLFGFASRYLLAKLGARVVYRFREDLIRRLLSTPYLAVERIGGHRILAAAKTDAGKLADALLVMPATIYNLMTVILCMSYMLYTAWQLFALVFVSMVIIFGIVRLVIRYALKHLQQLRGFEDELFKGLSTVVDGVKELTTDKQRRSFMYAQVLEPNFRNIRDHSVKVSLIFTMLSSVTSTLVFTVIGMIVFGSGIYFPALPMGVVVSFVLIILYMVNPLESVLGALNQLGDFAASYRNIESLALAEAADDKDEQDQQTAPIASNWSTLRFEQIAFSYGSLDSDTPSGEYQFSLGPIDVTMKRGEAVFLTGGNGCGKSTFAKLCVGLYQADSGRIQLDDQQIGEDISVADYQQLFSTIFSDFHLFEHVLNPSGELATDEEIAHYLQQLELGLKVTSAGGRLSTLSLSQGQRKRLALMMSYIENTPICLYDEWAADQDPRYREIFYTEIIPALKQQHKLVLVITHDDRYFHLADQLLTFEQGQIVKDVRPKELADAQTRSLYQGQRDETQVDVPVS